MTILDLMLLLMFVVFGAMIGFPLGLALGATLWKRNSNSYGKPPVANYTSRDSRGTQ